MTDLSKFTALDRSDFRRFEKQIDGGINSVGAALTAIRQRKLYLLAGSSSFDAYCKDRWAFGKSYANRLITAEDTKARLSSVPMGTNTVPTKERHLREIARAPDDKLAEVVEKAQAVAANEARDVTAQDYADQVDKVLVEPDPDPEEIYEDVEPPDPEPVHDWKLDLKAAKKHADALQRAIDDLNRVHQSDQHHACIDGIQAVIVGLGKW